MIKPYLLILLSAILYCLPNALLARHLIGGEMSYTCLGNGDYEVTLRVYRDCLADGANFDRSVNFSIFQCDGTIDCSELTQGRQGFIFEVELDTIETLNYPDPTCELPQLCVEQGIYRFRMSEFNTFLPATNNSYHIVHQRCCRNESITNIDNPGDFGNTFTIAITPIAQELCNTSPVFENYPPVITCINEVFNFQQIATDADGDSLVYSFSTPLHGGGNDVTRDNFESCIGAIPNPPCPPPFNSVSFIDPLYDAQYPFGNSGDAVRIDPNTGIIRGTPTLSGQFVVGLSVAEYRNEVLLSISQREFQVNIINCQNTNDRIGSSCDDGNPNTEKDRIEEDCACRGVLTEEALNAKDLFFSEYLESTNNDQCLEIYNPLDQAIAGGQYTIKLYNNTYPNGQTIHTLGPIPAYSTYLICQEASDSTLTSVAAGTFDIPIDGNEAITIEQGGVLIDLFGNRSCFPEDFWRGPSGLRSQNKTLIRCPCIQNGVKADPLACEFPSLAEEWICLPTDDFTNIGKHDTLTEAGSFLEILAEIYCTCTQTCRERDSLALVAFHTAANGEKWINTWDLKQPIDTWFGVSLNEEGCVACLDLDGVADCKNTNDIVTEGNNLTGFLSDQIGELDNLEALYLSHNHLSNIIPRTIGKLTRLQKLWLNANDFSGDFPVGLILLDSLQEVIMDHNQLTGKLPPEMAALPQLTIFTASNNSLIGCFPNSYLDLCNSNRTLNFSINPALPWEGDFEQFCTQLNPQVGANCDDGKEDTILDSIQKDCICQGQPSNSTENCVSINILEAEQDSVNIAICADALTLASDTLPPAFTRQWFSSNGAVLLDASNMSTISIQNIPIGITTISWRIDTINCTSYQPTIYEILRFEVPRLQADTFLVTDTTLPIVFDILANDDLANMPFSISNIGNVSDYGPLTELSKGRYELVPNSLSSGDQFTYEVCYEDCPALCAQTTATFQIQVEEPEVKPPSPPVVDENFIPNTITPNGDGLNDQLVFPQLQDPFAFPDNQLLIFSRWGDELFDASPYDNSWDGRDLEGQPLAEGTYYYLLRLDVGAGVILRGAIVILR